MLVNVYLLLLPGLLDLWLLYRSLLLTGCLVLVLSIRIVYRSLLWLFNLLLVHILLPIWCQIQTILFWRIWVTGILFRCIGITGVLFGGIGVTCVLFGGIWVVCGLLLNVWIFINLTIICYTNSWLILYWLIITHSRHVASTANFFCIFLSISQAQIEFGFDFLLLFLLLDRHVLGLLFVKRVVNGLLRVVLYVIQSKLWLLLLCFLLLRQLKLLLFFRLFLLLCLYWWDVGFIFFLLLSVSQIKSFWNKWWLLLFDFHWLLLFYL